MAYKIVRRNTAEILFNKEWDDFNLLLQEGAELVKELEDKDNVCATVYHCGKGLEQKNQNILMFDIDKIDQNRKEEYIDVIQETFGISKHDFISISTGNGIHVLIGILKPFVTSFQDNRTKYHRMCYRIKEKLILKQLKFEKVDEAVFATKRTTRIPFSINFKQKEGTRSPVEFMGGKIEHSFSFNDLAKGVIEFEEASKGMRVDSDEVLQGCEFIKNIKNANKYSYDEWICALMILSKLENGKNLCHEFSKNYLGYDFSETERKIESLKDMNVSCSRISSCFDCHKCSNFGKVGLPVKIHGEGFIPTESSRFRQFDPKTNRIGPIEMDDLIKYFKKTKGDVCNFIHEIKEERVRVYNGEKWEEYKIPFLREFVKDSADKSTNRDRIEFVARMKDENVVDYREPTDKILLKNGVFDLNTLELIPFDKEYYFVSQSQVWYTPSAECPKFKSFLNDLFQGREGKIRTAMQYFGYCVFHPNLKPNKFMIFEGVGGSGKTTFANIIRGVLGDLFIDIDVNNLTNNFHAGEFEGRRVALLNEFPKGKKETNISTNLLKNLSEGGKIVYAPKRGAQRSYWNFCKLLITTNNPPDLDSGGIEIKRRLLLIKFNKFIEKANENIIDEIMSEERDGIFNLLLEYYKDYRKTGKFHEDADVIEEKEDYLDSLEANGYGNSPKLFIKEVLVTNVEGDFISTESLYEKYVSYCESCRLHIYSKGTFSKKFKSSFIELTGKDCSHRKNLIRGFNVAFATKGDY